MYRMYLFVYSFIYLFIHKYILYTLYTETVFQNQENSLY